MVLRRVITAPFSHEQNRTIKQFRERDAHAHRDQNNMRKKPKLEMIRTIVKRLILLVLLASAVAPPIMAQTTETYTFNPNKAVPDGNASGLVDVRNVPSPIGNITGVKVRLKVTGEFNGDLYGYVKHSSGFTVLLNRPGKTAANTNGYADSGLDITLQNGGVDGDIHNYQAVRIPADGVALTGTFEPDGRAADPATVTDASGRTTSLTSFNGLDAAGEWKLYLADLASGDTNFLTQWSVEITGAATPTITWPTPSSIVYGTALSSTQLNATNDYLGSAVAGTFTYTPAAGTVLHVGTHTLTVVFTPTDTTSYLPATNTVSLAVTKKTLDVTADDQTKVYGSANPTLTVSYSGFVNSDTPASLTTAPTATTAATAASPVNTYVITPAGGVSPDYAFAYHTGTLTITPKGLTITANDKTKVYGAANPTLTVSYSGFVNSDDETSLSPQVSINTAVTAATPVGAYAIVPSAALNPNYSISFVNGTLTVTPAALSITADDASRLFGQANPTFTASYVGFLNGDTTNNLTTQVTLATTATISSPVGSYPITASAAAGTNYNITFHAGTLTIGQTTTSGTLASSANPALPGANVTFTMTLSPVAPGGGVVNGSVNFRIDGTIAGSGTLAAGVATYSTTSLSHGTHTVVAEYAGNANYIGTTNTLTPAQVINTPPVAGADTIQRYPTQGVKVRLATLLANDSDADGDTLSITVSAASANGGTVVVSAGRAIYSPASGFTGPDSFTYTITDGHGGSTVGTVTVAILVDEAAGSNLVITALSASSNQIRGNGIPGRTYRLQSTDDLNTPNWVDLPSGSLVANGVGEFSYTDNSATPTRFYRTVYP